MSQPTDPFIEPRSLEAAIALVQTAPPLRKIKSMLDRTDLSADMKALLFDIARITVKVGETVIAIGRRVLDIAMMLIQKFPNMVLGVIVALVLSTIVGAIPLVGVALAKLLVLLGLTAGAIADIRQNKMQDAMERIAMQFAPLSGAVQA